VIEAGRGAASSGSPPLPVREEAAVVAGGTQTAEPALRTTARAPVERPLASPAVRKRAADRGLDLHLVPGTGPGGRVTQQDLDAYTAAPARPTPVAAAPPAERRDGVEDIAILGLRRTIAERLQEAARHIPHFAFIEEVDVTALEELRQHLNATSDVPDKRPRLTLLPFLVRAIVNAVAEHRQVNARFDDEAGILHRHDAVHMGIATQTAAGLMVPVVRHAEALDLWQTAVEIARLAEAARAGKAVPTELTGSTITITSLGRLGGLASRPIINRPEVASHRYQPHRRAADGARRPGGGPQDDEPILVLRSSHRRRLGGGRLHSAHQGLPGTARRSSKGLERRQVRRRSDGPDLDYSALERLAKAGLVSIPSALTEAVQKTPKAHGYSASRGITGLRRACAALELMLAKPTFRPWSSREQGPGATGPDCALRLTGRKEPPVALGRRHVPAWREIWSRLMRRDREHKLDLAEIRGETGAATRFPTISQTHLRP
jgi:hypothetical protein